MSKHWFMGTKFDPYHILCICWIIHTFATLMCILSSHDLDLTEFLSNSRMFAILMVWNVYHYFLSKFCTSTKNTFQFAFVSKICLIYQQWLFEFLEGVVEMFSFDKIPVCIACLKEHWGIMNEYDFVTQDHVKQLSWRSWLLCRQNKELGWTAFCVEHQTREFGTLGDYQIR